MQWTLHEIAGATGASGAVGQPGESRISGVSIDSRTLKPGELFVAVRAERDGHDFAAAAAGAGAAALLVERRTGTDVPELVVADSARALLDLGRAARARLPGPVVGITGSVGKTSTKDLAAAALAAGRRTVASPKSFNNELGLPLTLANAPPDAEVVVLEMGARGPGHIALLCDVARPTIGVVTSVAAAHTEMFGDLDGVARAKGELVEALAAEGTAVLNGDDPRTRAMTARTAGRPLLFSAAGDPACEVVAEHVEVDEDLRPRFHVRSPWGVATVRLDARGAHQVGNALAALAVAGLAGVDLQAAAAAMETAELSPLRMEVVRTPAGATIINDAYNANPASMAAALRALASLPARRRVAVLGPMAELGAASEAEHRAVARLAAELGIEVVAVATSEYGLPAVAGPDEVVSRLRPVGPDTAVLVKASRVAALERVALGLREG
jgi:UDP-N-acetylmuramoyl-tripeptide--D-alanyl-D-alanine ligase